MGKKAKKRPAAAAAGGKAGKDNGKGGANADKGKNAQKWDGALK